MKRLLPILTLLLSSAPCLYAQSPLEGPFNNRAVLRHYQPVILQGFIQFDSENLDKIMYYFNDSYEVVLTDCSSCPVDYEELLNYDLFDISLFEALRKEQVDTTILFKKGRYQITLLSKQTVESNLGGLLINDVLNIQPARPLPVWVSTGNDQADYATYKQELDVWIQEFPERYRELTNGNGLIKMSVSEFLSLPQDKMNILSSNPEGYLLID